MGGRARAAAWVLAAVLAASCTTGGDDTTASSSTPTPTASATPAPVLVPAVLGAYEKLVLADGALGVWPLHAASTEGSAGLGRTGRPPAALRGSAPIGTTGPMLGGTAHDALAFQGEGRLITPVRSGFSATDRWTAETWVRSDGCSTEFERIGGTSSTDPRGRQGLDLFHYPSQAKAPCRLGAELWAGGAFLGGCASRKAPVLGEWVHFAVTYVPGRITCWLDGRSVGTDTVQVRRTRSGTPFGIGGSGNGFSAALTTASLADFALYPRALSARVLRAHAALQG